MFGFLYEDLEKVLIEKYLIRHQIKFNKSISSL